MTSLGIAVILEVENFKTALRPFLSTNGYSEGYAYKMASQMRSIAKHLLHLPEDHLAQIEAIVGRLKPASGPKMGKRNRDRLEPFDDPAIVQRVLSFPEEELARALKTEQSGQAGQGCRAGAGHLDPDLHGSQGQKPALAEAGYEHSPVRSPRVH
jgi:hypothetical protein